MSNMNELKEVNVIGDVSLPEPLVDGYLLTVAMLARGLDMLCLPRQVTIGSQQSNEVAFSHGVPGSSSLAGVTYAQDRRVRRSLLQRAKVAVPPGATFSYKGNLDRLRYARKIGYPVIVKESIYDTYDELGQVANNKKALNRIINEMRQDINGGEASAASITRAAYSLTGLLQNEVGEDGQEVRHASHRYLLEKVVPGQRVRILVSHGEVLAAIQQPKGGEWSDSHAIEQPNPTWCDVAIKAVAAIPHLNTAAVDLAIPEPTASSENQKVTVIELHERTQLVTYAHASLSLAQSLANQVLEKEAQVQNVALKKLTPQVSIKLLAENLLHTDTVIPKIESCCRNINVAGKLSVTDPVEGIVEGELSGSPEAVAYIIEAIVNGLFGHRAMAVEIQSSL